MQGLFPRRAHQVGLGPHGRAEENLRNPVVKPVSSEMYVVIKLFKLSNVAAVIFMEF